MIIKGVRLKNFISHADTEVDFPLGVTVIVGPNGAGKTSIIDAIVFSLFGEKVRGERIDDVIRKGAGSAEVWLRFESGSGKEYEVKWVRKKRSSEALLSRTDAGMIANTKNAVLEEISKILAMDRESAMNSIFIRQGEIASLVEADPKKRKNLLGKLIGLDRLEKAWEKMKEVIYHFDGKRHELEEKIGRSEGELKVRKEQRDKLDGEIENLEKEIKTGLKALENIKIRLEEAEEELNRWDSKRKRHEELVLKLAKLNEKINATRGEIEKLEKELKQSKDARGKLKKLEPEVAKIPLLEEYLEKLGEHNALAEERAAKKKDLDTASAVGKEAENSIKLCKNYVEEVEVKVEVKEAEEIPEELSELEKFTARIATKASGTLGEIKNKEKELEELVSKALKALKEATPEAKKAKLRELKAGREKLEERLSMLKGEKGEINGRIRDLKQAIEMLGEAETCPVCKTRLTPDHREIVRKEMQEEIESLEKDLEEVEDKIRKNESERRRIEEEIEKVSKIDVDRIVKLKGEIAELREKLAEHYIDLRGIIQKVDALESEIKSELLDINEKINEMDKILGELAEKIGYRPEDPGKDLKELRKKKEEYDGLKPIAGKYDEILQKLEGERKRLENLESEKNEIQEEYKKLGYDEKMHEEVKKNFEKLFKMFSEIKARLKEKKKLLEKKKEDLRKENNKIAELESELEKLGLKLKNVRKLIVKLENIRGAFSRDGVQKLLRQRVAPVISEFTVNYLERFNLDITDVVITEDFEISLIKDGEEISVKSLSGGEKVAVAIALRLAIAKVLAGRISTIIMDEPTTHLDEERRRELVDIMMSFFREGATLPQMIIVTHHRELEDVADTVYKVEKIGGVSKVISEAF